MDLNMPFVAELKLFLKGDIGFVNTVCAQIGKITWRIPGLLISWVGKAVCIEVRRTVASGRMSADSSCEGSALRTDNVGALISIG